MDLTPRRLWLSSFLLIGGFLLSVGGCSEPSEILAPHFESMARLAEADKDDCEKIGEVLNTYLKENREEMGDLLAQKGASSEGVAKRIYTASQRIDAVTEACKATPGVATYQHDLSALIIEKTGAK